jgi:hypothetical protein
MSKSYRPTIPVRYAAQVLGFVDEVCEANGADGLEECKKWLKAHGVVLSVENNGEVHMDTKVNLGPSLSIVSVASLVIFESAHCFRTTFDRFLLLICTCRNLRTLFLMVMHLLLWMIF